MTEVSGKTLFITGGAGGIGMGIARAFTEAGARPVIVDLDGEAAKRAAAELGGLAIQMDVADPQAWARAGQVVEDAGLGPVDILCNVAGVGSAHVPFAEIDPQRMRRLFDINLFGAFTGMQLFTPGMRGRGGHVINIASMSGLGVLPTMADYCASKAALIAISEVLSRELSRENVGVTIVCPGVVQSARDKSVSVLGDKPRTFVAREPELKVTGDDVGPMVLEAVLANRLYCFTHSENLPRAEWRMNAIRKGFEAMKEPGAAP